jgi:hypothetical protein
MSDETVETPPVDPAVAKAQADLALAQSNVDVPVDSNAYLDRAKFIAAQQYNSSLPEGANQLSTKDFYIVWFAKTLQNWKALLSSAAVNTGLYMEVTYDGDKKQAYVDTYIKVSNNVVTD